MNSVTIQTTKGKYVLECADKEEAQRLANEITGANADWIDIGGSNGTYSIRKDDIVHVVVK